MEGSRRRHLGRSSPEDYGPRLGFVSWIGGRSGGFKHLLEQAIALAGRFAGLRSGARSVAVPLIEARKRQPSP